MVLAVGVGVRPGVAAERIVRAVEVVVGEGVVGCLATVDRRVVEAGVRAAARILGVPLRAYSSEQLAGVAVRHESARTAAALGTPSVAEAAALLAGGGELVNGRTIVDGIVVATARMT